MAPSSVKLHGSHSTKPYCYAVLTAHITYLWHAPTVSLDPLDRAYGANNTLVISLRFYPGSLPCLPSAFVVHTRVAPAWPASRGSILSIGTCDTRLVPSCADRCGVPLGVQCAKRVYVVVVFPHSTEPEARFERLGIIGKTIDRPRQCFCVFDLINRY